MKAEIGITRQSERTVKQVRLDCLRALVRARLCPERSVVTNLDLVDELTETDAEFGSQLWYFEGKGFDEDGTGHNLFGVLEYSIQFGLLELIEDGVFDSAAQRERFLHLYRREPFRPSMRHPAHRWLLVGTMAMGAVAAAVLVARSLFA
ncbi:MAG: hypothetical protein AAF664_15600 [Planctomycetota bacterium]